VKTLGISITRDRLSALQMDRTLYSTKLDFACDVPCREPYGTADDIRELAGSIREHAGGTALPPAVLSLPAAWTFIRAVELPVKDLARAKEMHLAELDGVLPVEGDEILSDVLPPSPGTPGRFLAIAARKSAVERTASAFAAAGLPIGRVATDHLAIFAAALAAGQAADGLVLSTVGDLVVLRLEAGAVVAARQFPAAMAERRDDLIRDWRGLAPDTPGGTPVTVLGPVPDALAEEIAGAAAYRPPENLGDASVLALGAALLSHYDTETGGFSLQTSAEAESAAAREKTLVRFAAAAVAAAVVSAFVALETAQWATGRKAAVIQAEIRKEMSAAAPEIKNFVNASAQIRSKVQSLARQQKEIGAGGAALSNVLGKVSRAFPAKEKLSVRDVSFDSGRLRLVGDAENAALVESYRASLAAAFGPPSVVTVESTQGSARGGGISYTILIDMEAKGRVPQS
jgi:GspL periplasmic domain